MKTFHWLPLGALAIAICIPAGAAQAAAASSVNVGFAAGKLSVQARSQPASQVLSAITDKTGVTFIIDKELARSPVDVDVQAMELERAINAVIRAIPKAAGKSMSYASRGQATPELRRVRILAPGKALSADAKVTADELVIERMASSVGPPNRDRRGPLNWDKVDLAKKIAPGADGVRELIMPGGKLTPEWGASAMDPEPADIIERQSNEKEKTVAAGADW